MSGNFNEAKITRWFQYFKRNPRAKLRLFCFPYAGKGALVYKSWASQLPAEVEIYPVELPGRGQRFKEPLYTDIGTLVADMAPAIIPLLDLPFVFFGHSLGSIVSFELAHRIRNELHKEPVHMFVSGRRAPQIPRKETQTYNLPDEEFIEELKRLNGTPPEVLQHPELMQLMMVTLRADFQISETYKRSNDSTLTCPMTAFGGLEDSAVPAEQIEAWRHETTGPFKSYMLPGDHFFLHSAESTLLQIISRQLHRLLGVVE
ncbi:MAG: thioesterase domain-containing protein [Blastocatellia bacterium]